MIFMRQTITHVYLSMYIYRNVIISEKKTGKKITKYFLNLSTFKLIDT